MIPTLSLQTTTPPVLVVYFHVMPATEARGRHKEEGRLAQNRKVVQHVGAADLQDTQHSTAVTQHSTAQSLDNIA